MDNNNYNGVSFDSQNMNNQYQEENYNNYNAQNKGYVVTDATSQFFNEPSLEQVYLAIDRTAGYQIEFYEFDNDEKVNAFYETNKNIFEGIREASSAKTKSEISGSNHNKYTATASGKYMVISTIDNTAIYVNAASENEDEIEEILDEINY